MWERVETDMDKKVKKKAHEVAIKHGGGSDESPYVNAARAEAAEMACLGREVDENWIKNRASELHRKGQKVDGVGEKTKDFNYKDWYTGEEVKKIVEETHKNIIRIYDERFRETKIGLAEEEKQKIKENFEEEIKEKYSSIYSKKMMETMKSMIPMIFAVIGSIILNNFTGAWKAIAIIPYGIMFVYGFKILASTRRAMKELSNTQ